MKQATEWSEILGALVSVLDETGALGGGEHSPLMVSRGVHQNYSNNHPGFVTICTGCGWRRAHDIGAPLVAEHAEHQEAFKRLEPILAQLRHLGQERNPTVEELRRS